MKFYKIKILCHTEESWKYEELHAGEYEDAPLDLFVTRPYKLRCKFLVAYYPHKDKRATKVDMLDGSFLKVAMSFDKFDEMVMSGNYVITKKPPIL